MPRDDVRDDTLSSQRTRSDADTVGYDPATPADWPGGRDPGTVKDALDVLQDAVSSGVASRVLGRIPQPAGVGLEQEAQRMRVMDRMPARQPPETNLMDLRALLRDRREESIDAGQAILAARIFGGYS